jgi:nucleoid DNA-binding protein
MSENSENIEDRRRDSEKVTLAGLTARLSVRTGDTKRQTEDFLRELFALIAGELEKGESVKVPGLGVFKSIEVEARKSVNVNTGEETMIPGHRKIVYMASKELSATVNEPFSMFQTIELTDEAVTELEGAEAAEPEPEAVCDVPFASTVYELEEPEVIAESELERESAQEAASELIPELPETASTLIPELPEAFEPASEESPDSDDDPKDLKDRNDLKDTTDPDISEDSEVPAIPKKRFWPGFLVGFAAACLIAFVAVWALFEYGVLSSDRLAEAEPKPAVKAAAMTPASVEVPAVEPDKSKSEPEPAAKEPEVQKPEVQKSVSETEAEPPVPTQPSDKKVYDTITKTRYLTTMAKDHYGNYHLWPYIYKENEKILGHPDRIRPGTKVVVPPLSKYGVNPDKKTDIDKAKKLGNEIYARYN